MCCLRHSKHRPRLSLSQTHVLSAVMMRWQQIIAAVHDAARLRAEGRPSAVWSDLGLGASAPELLTQVDETLRAMHFGMVDLGLDILDPSAPERGPPAPLPLWQRGGCAAVLLCRFVNSTTVASARQQVRQRQQPGGRRNQQPPPPPPELPAAGAARAALEAAFSTAARLLADGVAFARRTLPPNEAALACLRAANLLDILLTDVYPSEERRPPPGPILRGGMPAPHFPLGPFVSAGAVEAMARTPLIFLCFVMMRRQSCSMERTRAAEFSCRCCRPHLRCPLSMRWTGRTPPTSTRATHAGAPGSAGRWSSQRRPWHNTR